MIEWRKIDFGFKVGNLLSKMLYLSEKLTCDSDNQHHGNTNHNFNSFRCHLDFFYLNTLQQIFSFRLRNPPLLRPSSFISPFLRVHEKKFLFKVNFLTRTIFPAKENCLVYFYESDLEAVFNY